MLGHNDRLELSINKLNYSTVELIRFLYQQTKPAIFGSFVLASCLLFSLYQNITHITLIVWYLSMIAITVIRLKLVKAFFKQNPPVEECPYWKRIFIAATIAGGILWATAGVLFFSHSTTIQVLITCSLAGVAGGAVPFYSGSRSACAAFTVPMLIPFSIWLFFQDHLTLSIFVILYLGLLLISSSRTHKLVCNAINLKFENDVLIKQLSIMNEKLATQDRLTNLPNRHLFNVQLEKTIESSSRNKTRFALLFLDLDHFKNINDALGHRLGDSLLIKVVERIQSNLSANDFMARVGGDEFMIIIDDARPEQIIITANKICQSFVNPFDIEDNNIYITTSIGISIYPDDGTDIQTLIKNVDLAIYRVKSHDRNAFAFYTPELNNTISRKLLLESHLRHALEKQEFSLHYQPLLGIKENKIISLEALLRWKHRDFGFISPSEFIPIAEEIGFIIPLSDWIMRTACEHRVTWGKAGYLSHPLRISINLSARHFKVNNLVELITQILKEKNISGEHLTFELTETLIMHDIEYSVKILKAFKDLGITIAIDDFGTCYSSLNYLRRLPVDHIKIDRSFITDITTNQDDAAITAAIIAMAHSLKMKVIAEGVETIEQYRLLVENQCDVVQGYLISKPLPEDKLISFLKDKNNVSAFSLQRMTEVHS